MEIVLRQLILGDFCQCQNWRSSLFAFVFWNEMHYRLADARINSSTNCSKSCEKMLKIGWVVFELNLGRKWKVCQNCTIFVHLAYWQSGSAGLIFAIFTSNESVLGVDDRSGPLFWYLKGRCHGHQFLGKICKMTYIRQPGILRDGLSSCG